MKADLFEAWRSAIERGELPPYDFIFRYFEPWMRRKGIDGLSLSSQSYKTFFAGLAAEGQSVKSLRGRESALRRYFRWALKMQLISELPFSEERVYGRSLAKPAVLTTSDIFHVWSSVRAASRDQGFSAVKRERMSRIALAILLAYHLGYSSGRLATVSLDEIVEVLGKATDLPNSVREGLSAYRKLAQSENSSSGPLFLPNGSQEKTVVSKVFTRDFQAAAFSCHLDQPDRFTVQQVVRVHKADFVGVRTRASLLDLHDLRQVKTSRNWRLEDVAELVKLHPRGQRVL